MMRCEQLLGTITMEDITDGADQFDRGTPVDFACCLHFIFKGSDFDMLTAILLVRRIRSNMYNVNNVSIYIFSNRLL